MRNRISKPKAIVLVHGIWMKGFEFAYLSHHLKKQGFNVYRFSYSSLFKTPEQNAERLYQLVSSLKESEINLIAHSLGGIVVSHLFSKHRLSSASKIIMIGTPLKGSAAAHYLSQRWWLKWLLGKSTVKGLLGDAPVWNSEYDLCMIAGDKGIGMGVLLARKSMQELNDGTVNLSETILEPTSDSYQCTEHHIVSHSHFALLWSKEVALLVLKYLIEK